MDTARKSLDNAFRRILRTEAKKSCQSVRRENLNNIISKFNDYYTILKSKWHLISTDDRKEYNLKFNNDKLSLEKCISKVHNYGTVKIPIEIDEPVVVIKLKIIPEEGNNNSESGNNNFRK